MEDVHGNPDLHSLGPDLYLLGGDKDDIKKYMTDIFTLICYHFPGFPKKIRPPSVSFWRSVFRKISTKTICH